MSHRYQCSEGTLVQIYHTTYYHIPGDHNLNTKLYIEQTPSITTKAKWKNKIWNWTTQMGQDMVALEFYKDRQLV
jgi:hypothetical protein